MISYTHKVQARSQSLRIKVEANGEVIVTSPRFVPKRMIEHFVAQHQDWIQTAQAKLRQRLSSVNSEAHIAIFGKKYAKQVNTNPTQAPGVVVQPDRLTITLPAGKRATPTAIKTTLDRFLKATAEKYIVPRTHQLAKIMSIEFHRLTLREQKSRWGSCSSQGNLNFNWRLVHYPPAIIDYVIIHELAHRREMNHSAAFWDLVRHYDPAYLHHRGWLKRNGLSVH